jgi:triacylglycerol lipase
MFIPNLRSPIVLVHGLLGYDMIKLGPWGWEYFRGIRPALEAAGNRILVPRLSLTDGVERRARQLRDAIQGSVGAEPVHIFAHSLGGLDARHLISSLGWADRVLSLTTIGTPHRGSSFADWGLRRFHAVLSPFFDVVRIPYRAFVDLSTNACAEFNKLTPDAPNVRYFSVAGRCEGPWLSIYWRLPHAIVEAAEGTNDGIVSIASATYGEMCEVWDGDHLNLINLPNRQATRFGLWVDRVELYGGLVRRLADCGF